MVASLKVRFWQSVLNVCPACPLGSTLIFPGSQGLSSEVKTQKTILLYAQYSNIWHPYLSSLKNIFIIDFIDEGRVGKINERENH